MWVQVFTLVGVVLGAASSFITTTLLERGKYRREKAVRWDAPSLQAFSDYLKAVAGMARMAGQAAGHRGSDGNAASRDLTEALRLMEEREDDRAIAFERVRLVADKATIDAACRLNNAAWEMEWLASGRKDGSAGAWQAATQKYLCALDAFHDASRDRLSMLVPDVEPRAVASVPSSLPRSYPDPSPR
jgi:hypothetical protein